MKILQIPFQFVIGQLGGTEIYVESLCHNLLAHGISSVIATPAAVQGVEKVFINGLAVFKFGKDPSPLFEYAYGKADVVAARNFRDLLQEVRPDLVHFHARSAVVSEALVVEAKRSGAKVVFTYHTPTVSCVRGTMMFMGRVQCDGVLDVTRCTKCVLQKHGLPEGLAAVFARTPSSLGSLIARFGLRGGFWTVLRMRKLMADAHRGFFGLVDMADSVVAVCDWVVDVLRRNGVCGPRLSLNRQGLPFRSESALGDAPSRFSDSGPLRVAYFGRLDATKGIDVLINAALRDRAVDLTMTIYGVSQHSKDEYQSGLALSAASDRRIAFVAPVAPSAVVAEMQKAHVIAVPSTGLETGPLVVLEAFAAGTPVMGSQLGGIAELVCHGVDGVLLPAGDVDAWAAALAELARDRVRLRRLASGISLPRTMAAVASEMASLYSNVMERAEIPKC